MDTRPVTDRFELRHATTAHVSAVNVPPRRLFAIDGIGPPRTPDQAMALEALRAVEDAVRDRTPPGTRLVARPAIECLWRPPRPMDAEQLVRSFATREDWRWELLIEVPDAITLDQATAAIAAVAAHANRAQPLLRVVELRELDALQTLAVGAPVAEAEALRRLLDAVASEGLVVSGDIHQILLTDPNLVDAARQRSILRVPVARRRQ